MFGCGPIGLAAIATLVDRGHERVVAVDLSPTRLELALGLGAQAALDPTTTDVWEELARLHGTDALHVRTDPRHGRLHRGVRARPASSPTSSTTAPSAAGSRWSPSTTSRFPTSYLMVLMKQFTIRGSMEYPARFADAIDLLVRRDLSGAHHPPLPARAVRRCLEPARAVKDCGKVLVSIDPDLF